MDMNSIIYASSFILISYFMGFIAAIPVGATQLEIARRSLNGFPSSAAMLVAGSVISDAMYGIIALFGIAPFLQSAFVTMVFGFVNAGILMIIGIWALIESKKNINENEKARNILKKKNISFITGFSLAVTNPIMIYWWLLGHRFISDFNPVEWGRNPSIIIFLAAGSLGIGSYLLLLTFGVYRVKKFFAVHTIKKITAYFGISLFLLAAYFIFKAVELL
jgi:threonine/homoserine/homoserine lactone efflux protein